MRHYLAKNLFNIQAVPLRVALIGCGGTGSHLVFPLAMLQKTLEAKGQGSLIVTVFDPDTVSEANIGRQRFYPSDIGFNKATVMATRVNQSMGLSWNSVPARFHRDGRKYDLVISAVDTAAARIEIFKILKQSAGCYAAYWLDCGILLFNM